MNVLGSAVWIKASRLRTDEKRRQVRMDPFRAIVGKDRRGIFRSNSLGIEEESQMVNTITIFPCRQRFPLPIFFEFLCRSTRTRTRPTPQTMQNSRHFSSPQRGTSLKVVH